MIRTLTLGLLAALLFTAGCKKEPEADRFVINGLHDINFNSSTTSNILPIQVMQMSGAQETVTISVDDLPSGFWAAIEPKSGTPTFGAMITIHQSGASTGGSYPFKVVARSASFTKSYQLNLIVPANGFSIKTGPDTLDFEASAYAFTSVERTTGLTVEDVTLSVSNLPAQLEGSLDQTTGKPSFSARLHLTEKSQLPAGNYPITVSGKSASATGVSTFVLRARPWSGYVVDGKPVRGTMSYYAGWNITSNQSTPTNTGTVQVSLSGAWFPSTDGVYTYQVGGNYSGPQMDISYSPESSPNDYYRSRAASANRLTLTRSNGKVSIKVDNITVEDGNTGGTKTISIDSREF